MGGVEPPSKKCRPQYPTSLATNYFLPCGYSGGEVPQRQPVSLWRSYPTLAPPHSEFSNVPTDLSKNKFDRDDC